MLNLYGEITKIIHELRIKHAIYTQHFRGPDEKLFIAGMKDRTLQTALWAW